MQEIWKRMAEIYMLLRKHQILLQKQYDISPGTMKNWYQEFVLMLLVSVIEKFQRTDLSGRLFIVLKDKLVTKAMHSAAQKPLTLDVESIFENGILLEEKVEGIVSGYERGASATKV
jgi:hypothetical protein